MAIDRRWFILLIVAMLGAILYTVGIGPGVPNFTHVAVSESQNSYDLNTINIQNKPKIRPFKTSRRKRKKENKQKNGDNEEIKRNKRRYKNTNEQTMEKTMKMRKELLDRECPRTKAKNLYTKDEHFYRWMFVNTDLKMVGCAIPKVGSTYMKRLTSPNHDLKPNFNKDERPTLEKFKPTMRKSIFQTYKKFLMVRNPYDRLWSAYTSKILQARSGEFQFVTRSIIETIRKGISKKEKKCSDDVTFFEFIRYIIYSYRRNIEFNPHWETYKALCHPCHVDYDVILMLEEFDSEVHYLLDSVGLDKDQQESWTFSSSSVDSMIEAACRLNTKMRCQDIDDIVEKNYQYLAIEGVVDIDKDRKEIIPLLKTWITDENSKNTKSCIETFKTKFAEFSEKDRLEIIKSRKKAVRDMAYGELGEKEFEMLQEIYEDDFKIFGYDPKHKRL